MISDSSDVLGQRSQTRDGSIYQKYRDISAIPILSVLVSYRIGVFNIGFLIYRIIGDI